VHFNQSMYLYVTRKDVVCPIKLPPTSLKHWGI
jgi:hypothetical protein